MHSISLGRTCFVLFLLGHFLNRKQPAHHRSLITLVINLSQQFQSISRYSYRIHIDIVPTYLHGRVDSWGKRQRTRAKHSDHYSYTIAHASSKFCCRFCWSYIWTSANFWTPANFWWKKRHLIKPEHEKEKPKTVCNYVIVSCNSWHWWWWRQWIT